MQDTTQERLSYHREVHMQHAHISQRLLQARWKHSQIALCQQPPPEASAALLRALFRVSLSERLMQFHTRLASLLPSLRTTTSRVQGVPASWCPKSSSAGRSSDTTVLPVPVATTTKAQQRTQKQAFEWWSTPLQDCAWHLVTMG